jgi:hypothetical protein
VGALAERYGLAGAFTVSAVAFAMAALFGLFLPETGEDKPDMDRSPQLDAPDVCA